MVAIHVSCVAILLHQRVTFRRGHLSSKHCVAKEINWITIILEHSVCNRMKSRTSFAEIVQSINQSIKELLLCHLIMHLTLVDNSK